MAKKNQKKQAASEVESLLEGISIPKSYHKGQIIEGTVVYSTPFEMIVDVNGRSEGIVIGRELRLDGKKVQKKVGDSVLVYVVSPENKEGLIELSIRRTGQAIKWHELEQAKKDDSAITVKVIEANTGGVIVEIGGGLRGFVPSSQLKNSRIYSDTLYNSKKDATKMLQSKLAELIGEELQVKVTEINKDKNRVILSEKDVYTESNSSLRNETLSSLKIGDVLEGEVTGIAPFGLFINAQGVEGLVHLSEISWDKVTNPADFYRFGDKIKVQVIGLLENGRRVAYSIKRLLPDPWKDIVNKYKIGQIVEGEVKSLADYGAFVKIEDGLNGLIHISELSSKLVKDPSKIVSVGDKIKVMIISISDEDRHLGLSLKRLEQKEAKSKKSSKEESETPVTDSSSRELDGLEKILKEAELEESK